MMTKRRMTWGLNVLMVRVEGVLIPRGAGGKEVFVGGGAV